MSMTVKGTLFENLLLLVLDMAPQIEYTFFRIRVKRGETLLMPAGWIHAVYSPADAITFGGNFLHGLSMAMQVRVVEMEERLRVPNREKFPHFWPLMWYVVAAYCQTVTPQHKLLQQ